MSSPSPKLDINVLPESYRRRRLQRKQILFLLALMILMALTVPLYQLVSTAMDKTADMKRQADILNRQVTLIKTKIAERAEKFELIKENETISEKRDILSEDVEAIKSAADQVGIGITSISHESDNVTVSCPGSNLDYEWFSQLLDRYCEALIRTGRFSSVNRPTLGYPLAASITMEVER